MSDSGSFMYRLGKVIGAYGKAPAQAAFSFGLGGSLLVGLLLANSAAVHRIPYGVAILCVFLGWLMHTAVGFLARHRWILPSDAGGAFLERSHKLVVALAVIAPLLISWMSNQTLYGALNPIGYWRDQASKKEGSCEMMRSVLANAAERYQVAENKYRMGIATSGEVRTEAESTKLLAEMYEQCRRTEQERVANAVARLQEIEQRDR